MVSLLDPHSTRWRLTTDTEILRTEARRLDKNLRRTSGRNSLRVSSVKELDLKIRSGALSLTQVYGLLMFNDCRCLANALGSIY